MLTYVCFYVCNLFVVVLHLATPKVISGQVLTCDSVQSWWLYSAAPLGDQTWYCYWSHYPDTEPTSTCPILIMPSTWLGSDKYQSFIRTREVLIPIPPKTGDGRLPKVGVGAPASCIHHYIPYPLYTFCTTLYSLWFLMFELLPWVYFKSRM